MFKIGRKTKVNAVTRRTLVPLETITTALQRRHHDLILPVQLNHGIFAVHQRCVVARTMETAAMGRGLLLWLIGIPIPIILLIWLFGGLHG
jgi:hypothetical protein